MLDSNLPQQCVVIVEDGSLFDVGITHLLKHGASLVVSHVIYFDDTAFLDIIKRDQPDAILVCESGALDTKQIFDSISIDPIVNGLCIFIVRFSKPVIDIYERPILIAGKMSYRSRSIIARTTNDLINILMGNIR